MYSIRRAHGTVMPSIAATPGRCARATRSRSALVTHPFG